MIDIFIAWPMPLVWLMLVGLFSWWRNGSGKLLAVAAILLIVSAMPIVGKLLHYPLSSGVIQDVVRLTNAGAAGVFVPTAGSFRDARGKWWPEEGSFLRYVAALKLAQTLSVPVIVGGGSPLRAQPAEANTVVEVAGKGSVDVIVVPKGRNSATTAEAVAQLPQAQLGGLVLVTHGRHIARMRAALRRQGLNVVASTTPRLLAQRAIVSGWSWRDVVPSNDGLDLTGAAVYEYVGLAWYLARGKVRWRDL